MEEQLLLTPVSSAPNVAFSYNGIDVTRDAGRLISLTDMWKAAGSPKNKDPREWRRQAGSEFIESLAKSLDVGKTHIIKSVRGKGLAQGTYAHWQIAMAYAKYLSPEFHRFVNEAFREWAEEKADPGLKLDRAVQAYRDRGYSDEWIERRLKGVTTRKALMSVMKDHNCKVRGKDNPYAEGTRSIALQVVGKTPKEFREEKGLKKSDATRDHYPFEKVIATEFAEAMSAKLMRKEAADGNEACVDCCRRAGKATRQAMESLGLADAI